MLQNTMPPQVRKRTGDLVPFNQDKITIAISKAIKALGLPDTRKAEQLASQVTNSLPATGTIDIETIQDHVEETLESHDERLYKIYSLYRRSRGLAREIKAYFHIKDDLKLSANALKVLEERYLQRDTNGHITETPTQLFHRVADAIAAPEKKYKGNVKATADAFYQMMANLEFLPNSPTLMNAGTTLGQLSACFVLPIDDSLESIFTTLKNMAIIQQSGGGTGFSFSRLREKGAVVQSTSGVASGPVSFMNIYDQTTDVIKQGGKRRGANIGILHCTHPDIEAFITAKTGRRLTNFNISVAITDTFMNKVQNHETITLRSPKTNKITKKIQADTLFNLIAKTAWETGDPGVLFIDEINRRHPLKKIGTIEATNPCGEVPLLPYESCNLGSINLLKMLTSKGKIDWEKLRQTTRLAVQFLDNVIDANNYPLPDTKKVTTTDRKIGLGVMGFAEMLYTLKIPYDSDTALATARRLIRFIAKEARQKSMELGQERGSFPTFKDSTWAQRYPAMRNATHLTIAPTGTISIIAGCSSGIEPVFALVFYRRVMEGKELQEISEPFKLALIKHKLYSEDLIKSLSTTRSVKDMPLPRDLKKIFVTAADIPPIAHLRMQAAFQHDVDNAVSKTVNLPHNATIKDIRSIYLEAWKLKCKGVTVYRYGSKAEQVLYYGTKKPLIAPVDFAGGSPTRDGKT
jgi:ribonucleoside-diphosphate reductase alpha chain